MGVSRGLAAVARQPRGVRGCAKGGEAVGSGSSREGRASHGSAAVAFISGTAYALPTTVRRAAADFMKLDIKRF